MQQTPTLEETVQFFKTHFRSDLSPLSGEPRWVGLENEYLIVMADGQIARQEVLAHLWLALECRGWEILRDDMSDHIIGVTKNRADLLTKKKHHYDVITTDLGYSILEIDLAPAPSLNIAQRRLHELIEVITSILIEHDTYLLGYGVQPLAVPSAAYIARKSRYAFMLDICQKEQMSKGDGYGVELHTIDASCQTQVEISADEAIPVVNALNATAGLRVALLANSPVWQNQISQYKALRSMFVDWCWPARQQQLGMPPHFQNIEHYVDYLFDFRSIMVRRNQKLYRIDHHRAFRHFFTDACGQTGIALDGEQARIFGSVEDINLQAGFAWFHTRLQPAYGTVEDRVSCQQPPQAHFCASALLVGLVENYQELVKLAAPLSLDQWRNIHFLAREHGLDFSYPGIDIHSLIETMVSIADQGLKKRGFGEEVHLAPLYKRIASRLCPADEIRSQFLAGGIANIVATSDMRNLL